jgi:rSAM/selenodomain-associated transferase 1
MPVEQALITVAKRPRAGATKTRLCPPLSLAQAAAFYSCLMRDTLALMARVPAVQCVVAYTPESARVYFHHLVPNGFDLIPQRGTDLGERLLNALAHYLSQGYDKAVIMNSDGPTLPVIYLKQAFAGLDEADVTLGPGHDGGYYLIGMKHAHAGLFEGITWSTEQVVPQTLARIRQLGLTVHCLPEWYDVDTAADMDRLLAEFRAHPEHPARCTRQFLRLRWR